MPAEPPSDMSAGARYSPTATPAIAPISNPINVNTKSRGPNRLSRSLYCTTRSIRTPAPSNPNIIGST